MEKSALERIETVKEWLPELIQEAKKELKNGRVKSDGLFRRKFFGSVPLNRIGPDLLLTVYQRALFEEKEEEAAEELINKWLMKQADLFDLFATTLMQINPELDQIKEIPDATLNPLVEEAAKLSGGVNTYLFCILNCVALSPEQQDRLKQLAANASSCAESDKVAGVTALQEQIKRIENRYEKKLSGMQRKYEQDTAALKKQIAVLQKKLNASQESTLA